MSDGDRYGIREMFLTLQGEGLRAGTKAVFLRFTGCNLWNGFPAGRSNGEGACAQWCDTDFAKGKVMSLDDVVSGMEKLWPVDGSERWVVMTGGEPFLQINASLVSTLHALGWRIAVETNGTVENLSCMFLDHICVAPKLSASGAPLPLTVSRPDEVKVVLPGVAHGDGWTPEMLSQIADTFPEAALFVQPMDPLVDPSFVEETALKRTKEVSEQRDTMLETMLRWNIQRCIEHVMKNPRWRMTFQLHKIIGLR